MPSCRGRRCSDAGFKARPSAVARHRAQRNPGIQRFMWGRVALRNEYSAGRGRPNRIGLNRLLGTGRYGDCGGWAGVEVADEVCRAAGKGTGRGNGRGRIAQRVVATRVGLVERAEILQFSDAGWTRSVVRWPVWLRVGARDRAWERGACIMTCRTRTQLRGAARMAATRRGAPLCRRRMSRCRGRGL